ncbi:MAG TPA: hypothetical protein VE871_03130 [Longimicrobium sp.]|nr:hypothetical protein [Longimicrobium sp.]
MKRPCPIRRRAAENVTEAIPSVNLRMMMDTITRGMTRTAWRSMNTVLRAWLAAHPL